MEIVFHFNGSLTIPKDIYLVIFCLRLEMLSKCLFCGNLGVILTIILNNPHLSLRILMVKKDIYKDGYNIRRIFRMKWHHHIEHVDVIRSGVHKNWLLFTRCKIKSKEEYEFTRDFTTSVMSQYQLNLHL